MNDLFASNQQNNGVEIDNGFILEYNSKKEIARLYRRGQFIRQADFNDRLEKKLFIIDAVEQGCNQTKLASALNISRQTINNYINTKKIFGLEGLIHGYNAEQTKNKRKQRQQHKDKRSTGNTARKLEQLRKEKKEEAQQRNYDLFDISPEEIKKVASKDQL